MATRRERKGPYARFYGPWLKELPPMGHNEWCVLFKLCERLDFDGHGNATAWRPRAEIAEELGLTERQVSDAAGRLVAKGVLSVKRPGHNGWATVYNVRPGKPWPSGPAPRRKR